MTQKTAQELYAELRNAVFREVPEHDSEYLRYGYDIANSMGIPHKVCLSVLSDLRSCGQVLFAVAFDQDTGNPKGSGFIKTGPVDTAQPNADVGNPSG